MTTLLKLEDIAKLILAYCASLWLGFSWWMFFALLLVPDISMIGYLVNPRVGAYLYNFAHHQALGIGVFLVGMFYAHDWTALVGVVLFGHSAMDRIFGYGLKHTDSFKHTHLGWMK